jgi:hypothetical protein
VRAVAVKGGIATLDDVGAAGRFAVVGLAADALCAAAVGLGGWLGRPGWLGWLGARLGRLGGAGSSGAAGGPPVSRGLPASARPPESHALIASVTPSAYTSATAAGDHRRGIGQA